MTCANSSLCLKLLYLFNIYLDSLESDQHLALQSLKSWIQSGSAELIESPGDKSDRWDLLETHVVEDLDNDLRRKLNQSYLSPHNLTVALPGAVSPGVGSHDDVTVSLSLWSLLCLHSHPHWSVTTDPFSNHSHSICGKKESYEWWISFIDVYHHYFIIHFYSQFDIIW